MLEGLEPATGAGAPAEGVPVHKIAGTIKYNDPREELVSIKEDPSAVRDVIVAKFIDVHGRASAEMVRLHMTLFLCTLRHGRAFKRSRPDAFSGEHSLAPANKKATLNLQFVLRVAKQMASLLHLIHSKSESFWSHSPSVFMQNLTPKMFFDALHALSTTAKTRPATSVMLEGRLYTFPLNFATVKSIVLGAMNRLIVRMHSLDSKDMVSVFMMTVAYLTYQKIQKHRTGKTLVMSLYQRDVLHLLLAQKRGELLEEAPHCAWLKENTQSADELIVKCSALRFFKIGSVDNIAEADKVSNIHTIWSPDT